MADRPKLGIIGGMGSVAAAYFFKRLIELTPAEIDQDYIETFVHNNTSVPDRTAGILDGKPSPLPELKRSVAILNRMGANYILLACMTSHYFVEELQKDSEAVIIDGIEETARQCSESGFRRVGVMGSTGTVKLGLFKQRLAEVGIEAVQLSDADQLRYFTEPIYADWGIKAGHIAGKPTDRLVKGAQILIDAGAEAVVAGCSELPLVYGPDTFSVPLVDAIDVLLKVAINRCLGRQSVSSTNRVS